MTEAERHLPVAPVALEVLLSLARGPLHGYGLIQDIRERTGGTIELATSSLYATLRRLEDAGLVSEARAQPDDSAGPPRRYYQVTRLGRAVAELELARLQRVAAYGRRPLREDPA